MIDRLICYFFGHNGETKPMFGLKTKDLFTCNRCGHTEIKDKKIDNQQSDKNSINKK